MPLVHFNTNQKAGLRRLYLGRLLGSLKFNGLEAITAATSSNSNVSMPSFSEAPFSTSPSSGYSVVIPRARSPSVSRPKSKSSTVSRIKVYACRRFRVFHFTNAGLPLKIETSAEPKLRINLTVFRKCEAVFMWLENNEHCW